MNSSENGDSIAASSYVLDASAVLALVLEEPGREVVSQALVEGATICAINIGEVVTRLVMLGFSDARITALLRSLRIRVVSLETSVSWDAGLLSRTTSRFGLSLGDRCCLTLARHLGLPALTTDRRWADLDIGVEVILCR